MMYTIEANIPVAKKQMPRRLNAKCYRYPFDKMEVGDSFFFEGHPITGSANVRAAAQIWGKRRGRKFTVRAVPDGYRVWRIA